LSVTTQYTPSGVGYAFDVGSFEDIFNMVKNMYYTKEAMYRINDGLDNQYNEIHKKIDLYLKNSNIKEMKIPDLEALLCIKIQ
jgi:hypothetical protein